MYKKGFFGLIGKVVVAAIILLLVGGVFFFFSLKDKYLESEVDTNLEPNDGFFPGEKEILEVIDAEKISFELHTDSQTEELETLGS